MPEWSTIGLFVMAASVLVAVPGPNSLYIIARSVEQGWRAGIASSLGVMVGTMLHIIAAALGVSALLLSSATAFSLVKYAGAAYLVYLGVRAIADKGTAFSQGERFPGRRLGRIFYRGVVVNALNPKTALFFTAFLPQFIDLRRGSIAAQMLVLGGVLILVGACCDVTYSLLAGRLGSCLRGGLRFDRGRRYLCGGVYIGLGLVTALAGTHRK